MGRRGKKFDEVVEVVDRIIAKMLEDKTGIIVIEKVADKAYRKFDPDFRSPATIHYTSVLQLRQIARGVIRRKTKVKSYEDADEANQMLLLAIPALQDFYPVRRSEKGMFIRRSYMTTPERRRTACALRKEGGAFIEHARLLDEETDKLIEAGKLPPDEQAAEA